MVLDFIMRSIWNTQHADESSASVGICQINILRYGLREKNRFPVSAIHNNASLSLSHYLTLDDTPPPHPLSSFDLFSHHFHFRHFRFWQIYWKQMYQFGIILSCHFKLWRHCIVWHIPSLFETKMFYPFIVKHIW